MSSHDKVNFDREVVRKIAKLAHLKLNDEETMELSSQLSKVIAHFDEISSVDTQNVEPLITATEIEIVLREDKVDKEFSSEEMVANAPEKQGNLFKVPPVV
ncbi:MAG: Asp-tRNA(Asn)/Glu-tRNA(Gln) amidotransferase subunit GatC [Pseudobdellovibrio sp.]